MDDHIKPFPPQGSLLRPKAKDLESYFQLSSQCQFPVTGVILSTKKDGFFHNNLHVFYQMHHCKEEAKLIIW